jgi:hypothetical protein
MRIFAAGLATAGAASYALNLGGRQGELGNSNFERLNLGLILLATGNTLLQTTTAAKPDSVLTFPAFWATALIFGATMFVAWGGYGKNSEYGLSLKRYGPLPIAKKMQDDAADIVSLNPDTTNSILYSVLTLGYVGAGAAYLFATQGTLEAFFANSPGPESEFLWRAIGIALITAVGASSYTLKEAAEEGRLAEKPFKVLNGGLAGAAGLHLAALVPLLSTDRAGPFLPALIGIWGLSFVASSANLLKGNRE